MPRHLLPPTNSAIFFFLFFFFSPGKKKKSSVRSREGGKEKANEEEKVQVAGWLASSCSSSDCLLPSFLPPDAPPAPNHRAGCAVFRRLRERSRFGRAHSVR